MCGVCGCSDGETRVSGGKHAHDHHSHDDDHDHHSHDPVREAPRNARLIQVEQDILSKNNHAAAHNRAHFRAHNLLTLNLMSSPGAGKTTLLVETLNRLKDSCPIGVIEGDQETDNDAARIRATGVPAIQVNTGKACHLDAEMVARAFDRMHDLEDGLLFIENVGNLVCPAGFDLGETYKICVISITEGEDKPLKYPYMIAAADLLLVNKIDLAPYAGIDVDLLIANARRVNPRIRTLKLSARTGEGFEAWLNWIGAARHFSAAAE
jgi:hydrogenase nickel incorporation protein HypB